MSPSVSITRRSTRSGHRYVVRFRLGGRETQPVHAGSFKTRKEAEARARWVAGEIASMRVPDMRLSASGRGPTLRTVIEAWLRSRVDVTAATRANYEAVVGRVVDGLGELRVDAITSQDIAAWVAQLVEAGTGRTVLDRCMAILRPALDDYRDPNPARSRSVKLPPLARQEVNPPPRRHWEAILENVSPQVGLVLRFLEGTGLRVGELVALSWGDVDVFGLRLLVRGGKTKAARRWVPVPAELVAAITDRLAPEDRDPQAPVFPGVLDGSLRMAMRRACIAAQIPLYSPHDLRHRYISLLVRSGMDPAAVSARVGHVRKSMTLDVYTHVFLGEEGF
jgi:integrase